MDDRQKVLFKNAKVLHLNLKKKWFDMIAAGKKIEEYRELKPYYFKRLLVDYDGPGDVDHLRAFGKYKQYDEIIFSNGYAKDRRQMVVEFISLHISIGVYEWGANDEYCFVIGLGKILKKNF